LDKKTRRENGARHRKELKRERSRERRESRRR
jgi:hypothetical protein